MKRFVLTFIFLLLPLPVWAITYYWASPGGGAGNCGAASGVGDPGVYRTFAQGMACLVAGDTLILKDGTYSTNAQSTTGGLNGTSVAPTTIKAQNRGSAILRPTVCPSNPIIDLSLSQYIVIDGLVLDGSAFTTTACQMDGIRLSGASYVTLQYVEVKNMPAQGLFVFWYGDGTQSDHLHIIHSSSHDNGAYCDAHSGNETTSPGCHGIYLEASDAIIEDSAFYNNEGFGIQVFGAEDPAHGGGNTQHSPSFNTTIRRTAIYSNDQGFYTCRPSCVQNTGGLYIGNWSSILEFSNNLIYSNRGFGFWLENGGPVSNNTLWQNTSDCIFVRFTSITAFNNICYQNGNDVIRVDPGTASATTDKNLLGTDPGFVSTTPGNVDFLKIGAGSKAALNVGDNSFNGFSCPSPDYVGVSRPQFVTCDIGAYEFTSGAPLPTVVINVPAVGATVFASPTTVSGTSSLP